AAIGEEAFVPVPVHTQSRALFLIEEKPLSFGRLELGARVESVRHRPEGTAGNDRDYTPLSLSAGLLWDLDAHRHLRLNLTRAQRAPVPEELYADGPHLATGTFELGAVTLGRDFTEETSTNLELSLDQHHGRFSATVNLFYNPIRDYGLLAATDEDGDGQADRVNEEGELEADGELLRVEQTQADARFYGAEAEARYRFLSGPLRLSGRVFADLVRGELDAGPHLPRITPTRYGLGLDGGWRGFQASLTLTEVADQTRVADLESPTEGYRLLSADLSHRWTLGELQPEVYVQGRNLLDEEARRHTSFLKDRAPLPGVTVLGGLRLRFF
ncbi:MAG TPA: TonB-dependent receptor, partial [Nevskiaceae bacterium]|nr:TonB-dependent receptor [Nevskiaceae bacterium]